MKRRGLMLERPFAHCYETGGMRRLHLRGRDNIMKRLLIHIGAFNLSLVLRQQFGKGTPRGLQDLITFQYALLVLLIARLQNRNEHWNDQVRVFRDNTSRAKPWIGL